MRMTSWNDQAGGMDGLVLHEVMVAGLAEPLSITIRPGEIGALVVEDAGAAGRLADVVTGCGTPISGDVLVAGRRIVPRRSRRRDSADAVPHRVGLVPSGGGLLPHLTVADNIGYGLRYGDGVPPDLLHDQVYDVAQRLEVSDVLRARPADLTPGRRLRVGLARALLRGSAAVVIEDRAGVGLRLALLSDLEPLRQIAVLVITYSKQRLAGLDRQNLVLADSAVGRTP